MSQKKVLLVDSISTNRDFKTKEEATTASGQLLLENGYIEKEYIDSMLEKLDTQLFATFIGNGVAIPHCRTPGVKKIYGFLAKLTTPVDFDAIDDQPVDLLFALVVPDEKNDEHLSTLARIAAIMQDDKSRQILRDCDNNESLFQTALAFERKHKL